MLTTSSDSRARNAALRKAEGKLPSCFYRINSGLCLTVVAQHVARSLVLVARTRWCGALRHSDDEEEARNIISWRDTDKKPESVGKFVCRPRERAQRRLIMPLSRRPACICCRQKARTNIPKNSSSALSPSHHTWLVDEFDVRIRSYPFWISNRASLLRPPNTPKALT